MVPFTRAICFRFSRTPPPALPPPPFPSSPFPTLQPPGRILEAVEPSGARWLLLGSTLRFSAGDRGPGGPATLLAASGARARVRATSLIELGGSQPSSSVPRFHQPWSGEVLFPCQAVFFVVFWRGGGVHLNSSSSKGALLSHGLVRSEQCREISLSTTAGGGVGGNWFWP